MRIPVWPALVLLLSLAPAVVFAQDLPLKRDVPPPAWEGCPAPAAAPAASPANREEAQRLGAEATQAAILGDRRAAWEQLARAVDLDPRSPDLAFRLAVAIEQLGRSRDAAVAYCRYLAISPDSPDGDEIRERIAALVAAAGPGVSPEAARTFSDGLAQYDAGNLERAEALFGEAWEADRSWSAPLYNRAVVRLAAGRSSPALDDLRAYLELSPGAPDVNRVLGVILAARGPAGSDRAGVASSSDARGVLVRGMLVPGLGHFTTGRPRTGLLVLGGAAAALGLGLTIERTQIDCLAPLENGRCPEGQVLRERKERPYTGAGIAAAAAVGFLGALDAYRSARRRGPDAAAAPPSARRVGATPALLPPTVIAGAAGDVRMELVRLRF